MLKFAEFTLADGRTLHVQTQHIVTFICVSKEYGNPHTQTFITTVDHTDETLPYLVMHSVEEVERRIAQAVAL